MILSSPEFVNWNPKRARSPRVFAVIVELLKFVPPINSSFVISAISPRLFLNVVPFGSGIHSWPTSG